MTDGLVQRPHRPAPPPNPRLLRIRAHNHRSRDGHQDDMHRRPTSARHLPQPATQGVHTREHLRAQMGERRFSYFSQQRRAAQHHGAVGELGREEIVVAVLVGW